MKKILFAALLILLFSLVMLQDTQTKANPFKVTPTQPINDPPTISIQSPTNSTYNQNTIPLNITITQPESWIGPQTTNETEVVLGPNTIKSITCTLDGQPFRIWNGTLVRESNITYVPWNGTVVNDVDPQRPIPQFSLWYNLPIISESSAILTAEKGTHNLEINVEYEVTYFPSADFPFPNRNNLDTSSNVTFSIVTDLEASKLQGIDSIHAPILFPNRSYRNFTVVLPTSSPNSPQGSFYPMPRIDSSPTKNQNQLSNSWLIQTSLVATVLVILAVAVASVSMIFFKKHKPILN